jgi:hypothetical protein
VTISSPNSFAVTSRDPSHSHNCRPLPSHSACHLLECLIDYRCDQLHTRGGGKAAATRAERRTPAHLPFLCVRSNLCVTAVIVFGSPATTSELASVRVRYQQRSSKIPDPCLQPRLHPPNGRARPAKSSNRPAFGNRRSSLSDSISTLFTRILRAVCLTVPDVLRENFSSSRVTRRCCFGSCVAHRLSILADMPMCTHNFEQAALPDCFSGLCLRV